MAEHYIFDVQAKGMRVSGATRICQMMLNRGLFSLVAIVALVLAADAHAAVLANYNFSSSAPNVTGTYVNASNIATGSAFSGASYSGSALDVPYSNTFSGPPVPGSPPSTTDILNAQGANSFVGFQLSATTGSLYVDGLQLQMSRSVVDGFSDFAYVGLTYSLDNINWNVIGSQPIFENSSFPAFFLGSNPDFQGTNSSISFRLVLLDNVGSGSSPGISFDNLAIEGSVVPEPASMAIWGIGSALGVVVACKRRRK